MKTIQLKGITIGNFQYDADLELTDTVQEALLKQGALRVLQGKVSGEWEKSIAYPGKGVKRPEGFNRKAIPFSEENAALLAKVYKGAEVEVGRNEKDEAIMEDLGVQSLTATEYTGAAQAEPKYKLAKDFLQGYLFEKDGETPRKTKTGEDRTIEAFATARGITAPTEPWEEDSGFLKAVQDWYKAAMAEQD